MLSSLIEADDFSRCSFSIYLDARARQFGGPNHILRIPAIPHLKNWNRPQMGVPAKMAVLFFINSKYPAVCVRKSPLDKSAHDNLKVDYCIPIFEMGMLLEKLTHERPRKNVAVPADVRTELVIAERVLRDAAQVNELGSQVPYNCPNFGGVLWEMDHPDIRRFRCHTGHSFTESALLTSQSENRGNTVDILANVRGAQELAEHHGRDESRKRKEPHRSTGKRNTDPH
jgi:hypothetical protein